MSINRVNISGNLTRDPELRQTGGGTQVLSFGVAVNDRRRNTTTGNWEDYPNFVDCVVFGARAEPLSRFLSKGSKVAIEGKLRYSSWEGKDGQRRSKLEVIVDELEFLSPRNQNNGGGYQDGNNYQGGDQGGSAYQGGGYQNNGGYQGGNSYQSDYGSQGSSYQGGSSYQSGPSYSAPAPSAPQQTSRPVSTPPSADVYDEDIPF